MNVVRNLKLSNVVRNLKLSNVVRNLKLSKYLVTKLQVGLTEAPEFEAMSLELP